MNSSSIQKLTIRLAVLIAGLAIFVYYLRQFKLRSLAETLIFIFVIALVRLSDRQFDIGAVVSFDAAFVISAILLFPLADALFITIGGLLLAILVKQERTEFGGPLYVVAERSLLVFTSALWLSGRHIMENSTGQSLAIWVLSIIGVCVTYFLLGQALPELNRALDKGTPYWTALFDSMQSVVQIDLALASIGVLTALMYRTMSVYILLLFIVPLLVVRYSFRALLDIKSTYRHTIAALSRMIEVEDPSQRSHSERVADLAADIGRDLGLTGSRLEAVSYAALLHDIGRLGLDANSFDSFLDTEDMTEDQIPHALIGAEILEQVAFLRPFAPIVAKHHLPYTPNRRNLDAEHPPESRIIAVANYFDQLTLARDVSQRLTPNQAVAKIKKEAFQFDPKVVRSLIDVLRRQGRLIVAR